MTIRYRVEPFSVPRLKPEHRDGVFADFADIVDARIRALEAVASPFAREKARFFRHLLATVDADGYRRLQDHHLSPAHRDPMTIRYLDPVTWFESKLATAHRLELHSCPPMRILDIGTGPGHFPMVARFYGHEVTASDVPDQCNNPGSLYSTLCRTYGTERVALEVQPLRPLAGVSGHYRLVTAFLAAFNMDHRLPWDAERWRFFLRDLVSSALDEGGGLFMSLTNGKLTAPAWSYLVSRAKWSIEHNRQVFITDFRSA